MHGGITEINMFQPGTAVVVAVVAEVPEVAVAARTQEIVTCAAEFHAVWFIKINVWCFWCVGRRRYVRL